MHTVTLEGGIRPHITLTHADGLRSPQRHTRATSRTLRAQLKEKLLIALLITGWLKKGSAAIGIAACVKVEVGNRYAKVRHFVPSETERRRAKARTAAPWRRSVRVKLGQDVAPQGRQLDATRPKPSTGRVHLLRAAHVQEMHGA